MNEMEFEVQEDNGKSVALVPLRVSILHSGFQVNLADRLEAIARDWRELHRIQKLHPTLAAAIHDHCLRVKTGVNSYEIRRAADRVIELKSELFGQTNAGAATTLIDVSDKPDVEAEETFGEKVDFSPDCTLIANGTAPLF